MAEVSPVLLAVVIVVIIIAVILVIMVLLSRESTFRPSSTQTAEECLNPPGIPTNLSVSNPQGDLVILTWDAVSQADTYIVYIGDDPNFNLDDKIASRTTRFSSASFANLNLGVIYYFKVRAVNFCGESDLSAETFFSLPFVFPNRFEIVHRTQTALPLRDRHTSIYSPSDKVFAYVYGNDLSKWMFRDEATSTIRQSDRPTYCLTRAGGNDIYFNPCVPNDAQKWIYNAKDFTICSASDPSNGCINLVSSGQFSGVVKHGAKDLSGVSGWDIVPS